nr:hypothetical protein [Pseudomonas sp. LPH1]
MPYSDVISIEIDRQNQVVGTTRSNSFSGASGEDISKRLFGSEPFAAEAKVLGFITAKILISFKGEKGARKFVVYNDRLIEDTTAGVFYYAMPGLKDFLNTI